VFSQGNGLFHVDSSFNPRRAGYSLLRAHELPPRGTGGNTEYADTRTAFDELPAALKQELVEKDYIAAHSLWHSRKTAAPEFFADIQPEDYFMSRHKLIQRHEPSGRTNLYIAAHVHHIEGLEPEKSKELFQTLYRHAMQPKYVLSVEWENDGDLILWDNTCVMHRATGGSFEGKYRRDMRRTTVHDGSSLAWGLNEKSDVRQGLP
jgi:alpha-ketoglutarate-dependent 2,4-dichlorophenoxyacetate dioxygenase